MAQRERSSRPAVSDSDDMAELLRVVRELVTEVSDGRGLGRVAPDVSFERELGLGSLERVELAARAGETFGATLGEDAIADSDSPTILLKHIYAARGRPSAPAFTPQHARSRLPTQPPANEPADASTLVEVFEYHVRNQPNRVHIVLDQAEGRSTQITYSEIYQYAICVAGGLRARGLQPGRCVALMLPTGVGYFAAFFGVLLAGGVPVPLYPPVRLDRIREYIERCTKILDNAQAQFLITFDRAARVAQLARDRVHDVQDVLSIDRLLDSRERDGSVAIRAVSHARDTALLQYTSGSTGDPKGVDLTQANVLANIRAAREGCALNPADVMVSWLPLYHDMGLIGGWLMPFYYGVPTVLMSPMAFLSKPERWLRAITDYGGTTSIAPNFAFDLCVKRIAPEVVDTLDLSSIRALLNGSEPISPRTLDRFVAAFARAGLRRDAMFCAYGLAENMVAVAFPPVSREPKIDRIDREVFEARGRATPSRSAQALEFVSVGSAVPGHEIRVVDANEQPVPARTQGEIQFRGPSSFKGYYRRPDATAKVQRENGWVATGDLGYVADGELFVTGRIKDIIIKAGRNYYPHELESAAASVSGIRQGCVAAFSVPSEQVGTEQIIVVAETRELDEVAREALQRSVIEAVHARVGVPPDHVVLAEPGAVPKTSSGKVRRQQSKAAYLDGSLTRGRPSATLQAAGLFARSLPRRIGAGARKAASVAYGGYAAATLGSWCATFPLLGRLTPSGALTRSLASTQAKLGMTLAGLRPTVSGLEHLPTRGAVLVANHASYLDFLVCMAALPRELRFVIKAELRENALVGPVLDKMGHLFVNRQTATSALHEVEEFVAVLRDGHHLMIFPEGTFDAEVGLRAFKLGAFQLAAHTQTPIVPVAISGSRSALRDGTWLPKHHSVAVDVLPPIAPVGQSFADIVALRDQAAEVIASTLNEPRLFAADIRTPS